jgi:3-dehydroquinate dehydratase type I
MHTVRIGKLHVGRVPRVVGVLASAQALRRAGAGREYDMAEVRFDQFDIEPEPCALQCRRIEAAGTPVLLTIRSTAEGGSWSGHEVERRDLYRRFLRSVSAIDVEIRSGNLRDMAGSATEMGRIVIGSFHDLRRTPDLRTLQRTVRSARAQGAHIVKVATLVRRRQDVITLFELLRMADSGPVCAIGMGPLGVYSRIALPCAGSCLAYGFVDRQVAPGQASCAYLCERLAEYGMRKT